MIIAQVENIPFMPGMELWINAVPSKDPCRFSINVGDDDDNVTLFCDVRFKYFNDINVIVLNTRTDGKWGEELRVKDFPFQLDREFEVAITNTHNKFQIKLPNEQVLTFLDRLDVSSRNRIWVKGDVTVRGISIK